MGKFLNEKGLSHFYQKIKEYLNNHFGTGTYSNNGKLKIESGMCVAAQKSQGAYEKHAADVFYLHSINDPHGFGIFTLPDSAAEYANFKNYIDLQNKSGSKITVVMVHKRLNQSTGGESSTSAPDSDELIGEISICQLEADTNEKAEIPITFGESIFAFW